MKPWLFLTTCLVIISATNSPRSAAVAPNIPASPGKQDRPAVKETVPGGNLPVIYMAKSIFYIPVQIPPEERAALRELRLLVSDNGGKTYRTAEVVHPRWVVFSFRAPRDGHYWFVMQTVDAQGKTHPKSAQRQGPDIKVCVDTRPPQVRLKAMLRSEPVHLEWEVSDRNLDVQTLRLEYRGVGTEAWTALPVAQRAVGQYRWNPPDGGRVEIRLHVKDKARNIGEAKVTIGPK